MRFRDLGGTEVLISEIGFGAWGIGGKQWLGAEDQDSVTALRRSFELGVNFVDTALAYGDGHSEQLVGSAIVDAPHKIYVATKIPPLNRIWPATPSSSIQDVFPYQYIVESTEQSLKSLKVERIDLQQFHVWTDAWVDTEDWLRAVQDLKSAGKVHHFGISASEHDPNSCLQGLKTGMFDAVQVIYNIFDQTPETNLFPLCKDLNIGVLARVPLDEGGLTGTITEQTRFEPGEFRDSYFRGNRKREVVEHVEALKRDLANVPGTLAEIALRFCLSHEAVTTVIPGMRRISTVESSCRASDAGKLSRDELAMLKRHAWNRNYYQ